jgi:alanine dehydrogenase
LAPDPVQAKHLLERKVVAIAYETVTDKNNQLPLLIPMSEIAGRISIQVGAVCLQLNNGGKGVVLGGVPGVLPASIVIIGGGVVGVEAAKMGMGLGANVTILDRDIPLLRKLNHTFGSRLQTLYSTPCAIEGVLERADLVIGAVLIPGKTAPKLITKEMLKGMQPGSVIVDVAIDQGGCTETSRPTTHSDPTYVVDGIIHYCVTNMPGACGRTATQALTNATMSAAKKIANLGYRRALLEDAHLRNGLNVCLGHITYEPVAADLGLPFVDPMKMLQ